MFKFSVNKADLLKLLSKSTNILSKNPKMEIYSVVKMTLQSQSLTLEATGSSCYLNSSIPANFEASTDDVIFLLKPDLIIDLLPLIKDEIVYFELDLEAGTLNLKSTKTKQSIRTYNHFLKEYIVPTFNNDETEVDFLVLSKDFTKAIKIANTSVGKPKAISDTKFTNICFSFPNENQLTLVSTDKFRISKLNVAINHSKEINETRVYLISPKTLSLVTGLIENQDSINFVFQSNYAWVNIGSTKLAIQYGGHEFPDVNRIIPQSFSFVYNVNTEEFKDGLKQIGVIARKIEKSKAVAITIDGLSHTMKLESKAPDGSSLETVISIENYNGPEEIMQQSFNLDYILDFINQIDETKILLEQQQGKVLISPEDKKDQCVYLASGLKS
jgi:DNA polymerase III sliding clamp (beta) subunit (PCNA family)